MKIAIIPARSGSKRIPNKNIKEFCGKPIIAYAIQCAKRSNIFDKIMVSTDSYEILEVAKHYGASGDKLRVQNLSDDFTTTLEVIQYEIKSLNLNPEDIVCVLYPTTPLLREDDLKEGLNKLSRNSFCFSACEFHSNPLRGFFIKNNKITLLKKELENSRSQDLEILYHDAGQFYFGYADTFMREKSIFKEDSSVVLIDSRDIVDINTIKDWEYAELKYKIICKQ